MSVSDWSTSAALNTTVGGVNIAPGMARSDVDNAIRAMMSELKAKFDEEISVKNFGAVGDGVTDDTTAINAAISYAKTLSRPKLIIDRGQYKVTTGLVFDLPSYSTIEFIGEIVTANTLTPTVMIGSSSANTFGLNVSGIKVSRTANDTTGGSIGVQMRNIAASDIQVTKVTGFHYGVDVYADQPNGGVSYCKFQLGWIQDNRTNLRLRETGSGYVNENLFFGGNFNHSSGYPAVSTINLSIEYLDYRHNNNRFYSPSFEDNSTLAVAAVINGDNNLIVHPRMERSVSGSTYEIQFTANSSENQIIGAGFSLLPTNINDAGTNNSYETRQGVLLRKQTPAGAGNGALSLQSTASSSARLMRFLDAGGVERGFIDGSGNYQVATVVRYDTGHQLLTARKTGWATATGTATRTTFDTATVTLPQLAERVKALIDDLHATAGHGLIGA